MDSFHIILEKWQEYEYLMDLKKLLSSFKLLLDTSFPLLPIFR